MPSLAEITKQLLKEKEIQEKKTKTQLDQKIIPEKKIVQEEKKKVKKLPGKKDYKLSSDNLRTIYYMLSGSSSRKRVDELKRDLINILKNN